VLGPLTLAAGSPADNYNVYISVRIFDTFYSFPVYSVVPIQVRSLRYQHIGEIKIGIVIYCDIQCESKIPFDVS